MALAPFTIAVHHCLNTLATIGRGEVIKRAAELTDVPWVREAFWFAGERDTRIVGRFDLIGPDRRTPWPSVLVEVRRRPRHHGQRDRKALVAVYLNEQGEWESATRETGNPPWEQFRGDRDGEPSPLNGDDPKSAEECPVPHG